jgi:hypothetical protein
MPTTSRTSTSAPRVFVVPVVRELPRPLADHARFATTW